MSALLGVVFLIAFVRWELHTDRPLFDVRLLLEGRFGSGSLVNVLGYFYAFGTLFNGVQYRSFTLGYGPVKTGLSLVSMAILTIPMGLLGPRWARRYGARFVMSGGLALMALGSIGGALAATTHTYHWVALSEVVAYGGLGLVGGPATEAIVDALPDSQQGVASAVNDTTRELGVAVGVALLGSTFNLAYRNSIGDNPNALPDQALDVTRDSPLAGLHVAGDLAPDAAAAQVNLVRDSVATGMSLAWVAAAVILALGTLAVLLTHPQDSPRPRKAGGAAPEPVAPTMPDAAEPATLLVDMPVTLLAAQADVTARIVAQLEDITGRLDRLEARHPVVLSGPADCPPRPANGHRRDGRDLACPDGAPERFRAHRMRSSQSEVT
jgi:hypothetical protein